MERPGTRTWGSPLRSAPAMSAAACSRATSRSPRWRPIPASGRRAKTESGPARALEVPGKHLGGLDERGVPLAPVVEMSEALAALPHHASCQTTFGGERHRLLQCLAGLAEPDVKRLRVGEVVHRDGRIAPEPESQAEVACRAQVVDAARVARVAANRCARLQERHDVLDAELVGQPKTRVEKPFGIGIASCDRRRERGRAVGTDELRSRMGERTSTARSATSRVRSVSPSAHVADWRRSRALPAATASVSSRTGIASS